MNNHERTGRTQSLEQGAQTDDEHTGETRIVREEIVPELDEKGGAVAGGGVGAGVGAAMGAVVAGPVGAVVGGAAAAAAAALGGAVAVASNTDGPSDEDARSSGDVMATGSPGEGGRAPTGRPLSDAERVHLHAGVGGPAARE